MSYPTGLPVMRDGSRMERLSGIDPVRASNGVLKVRRLYGAEKAQFTLVHWLTNAQRATLDACFESFKTGTVTLTWPADGIAYTCRFADAPQYEWRTADLWVATVRLHEV
jgi:hypothetical protein